MIATTRANVYAMLTLRDLHVIDVPGATSPTLNASVSTRTLHICILFAFPSCSCANSDVSDLHSVN